jgi:hypothetical protein
MNTFVLASTQDPSIDSSYLLFVRSDNGLKIHQFKKICLEMNDESFRIFTEVLRAALHSKWLHATTGKGGCINLREATEERGRM